VIIREQIRALEALAERKGRVIPRFVFPGPGARAAVIGAAVAKAVKREQRAGKDGIAIMGIAPWTPHDLRRSAATHMEQIGVSPFIVGHVLNHRSVTRATVTSRIYARYDYAKEKREALDLWADRLAGILMGSNVVPLRA
jgi:integrase